MHTFESVLKFDRPDQDGNRVEIHIYSSPYGAYLSQKTYLGDSNRELSRTVTLLNIAECKTLAHALESVAEAIGAAS